MHGLLNGDVGSNKDIVLSLGLNPDHILLYARGDRAEIDAATADIETRDIEARWQHLAELSEILHGVILVLGHSDEAIAAGNAAVLTLLRHVFSTGMWSGLAVLYLL
jgi:hypothetical protein